MFYEGGGVARLSLDARLLVVSGRDVVALLLGRYHVSTVSVLESPFWRGDGEARESSVEGRYFYLLITLPGGSQ